MNPQVLLHVTLAEIGLFAFLWVFVELLNPTGTRINRAKIASLLGVVCLLLAWVVGGHYYVDVYGLEVKPAIKASDAAWVHGIVMEVKEHVFLFLPILSALAALLLYKYDKELLSQNDARVTIVVIAGLIFLLGFSIAGMGAMIAGAYRFALMAGVA